MNLDYEILYLIFLCLNLLLFFFFCFFSLALFLQGQRERGNLAGTEIWVPTQPKDTRAERGLQVPVGQRWKSGSPWGLHSHLSGWKGGGASLLLPWPSSDIMEGWATISGSWCMSSPLGLFWHHPSRWRKTPGCCKQGVYLGSLLGRYRCRWGWNLCFPLPWVE